MVFYAHKFKMVLLAIFVLTLGLDLYLMSCYGFSGQALILAYVMVGALPLCALVAAVSNMVPTVKLDGRCKTIVMIGVYDDRHRRTKLTKCNRVPDSPIHFDEVQKCQVNGNTMVFTMKWGHERTLYLSAFSKRQIHNMKAAIDKMIA